MSSEEEKRTRSFRDPQYRETSTQDDSPSTAERSDRHPEARIRESPSAEQSRAAKPLEDVTLTPIESSSTTIHLGPTINSNETNLQNVPTPKADPRRRADPRRSQLPEEDDILGWLQDLARDTIETMKNQIEHLTQNNDRLISLS